MISPTRQPTEQQLRIAARADQMLLAELGSMKMALIEREATVAEQAAEIATLKARIVELEAAHG